MKRYLIMAATAVLMLTLAACMKQPGGSGANSDNPFFQKWTTQFEVPPFDKIKVEHFLPAIEEGIKLHNQEIDSIANNSAAPTFDNTIAALDYSGQFLSRVSMCFDNWTGANATPELEQVSDTITSLITKHNDDLYMNAKLFTRIQAVYNSKDKAKLNPEQLQLLNKYYRDFKFNGASLNDADKAKLRELNQKLAVLQLKFSNNMLAETNAFKLVVDKESDLAGLPPELVAAAKETADETGNSGKWVFTLQNPSVMPFLQYADNRDLRKKIWDGYVKRGNQGNKYDNNQVIKDIMKNKLEKAKLLGYPNCAEYILQNSMAKHSDNVFNLLNTVWPYALNAAKNDLAAMQKIADSEGKGVKIEPWDWRYYENKLKSQSLNFDENQTKPYFELNKVRDGLFYVIKSLYGVTFKKLDGMPKFTEDMDFYEVLDRDGKHLAVVSYDFSPRATKRGGAWMSNYSIQFKQNGKNYYPYIPLTFNFTKPTKSQPALLTIDEVQTMFHETGHALHGIFSDVTYPGLQGTNVYRDFVEMPSQIMENWALEPAVLKVYAKNYKTGETIPDDLIAKVQKARVFGQGFAFTELLAAAYLDMKYHVLTDVSTLDPQSFETKTLNDWGLIPQIISRYKSTYFNHVFGGGYDAGYWSYTWAEMLDADVYSVFQQKGIFDQETATKFRKEILSKGGTAEPEVLYKNFRGFIPGPDALLKLRGLK